ncbi:hypothetical protein FDP41_010515 [Naegleria fowleri]|uniref:Uncharacterized protein n=1 Tax=Naegleria fowleri TaxID=5763 RepID=A0A6A5CCY0_NAEFO|nr:uncharacterized protein FDP41_010515 [Naegleria fowleri]KAF0983450.1 hypothetical protein FDP41_010515 [Naegleria fowleri]
MDPVLHLISEELLSELRALKEKLFKQIEYGPVPSIMEIFNGYLLGDSKELQSQMNDNMEDEDDTLLEETISKLDGSKLEEYLTKQYKIRELTALRLFV